MDAGGMCHLHAFATQLPTTRKHKTCSPSLSLSYISQPAIHSHRHTFLPRHPHPHRHPPLQCPPAAGPQWFSANVQSAQRQYLASNPADTCRPCPFCLTYTPGTQLEDGEEGGRVGEMCHSVMRNRRVLVVDSSQKSEVRSYGHRYRMHAKGRRRAGPERTRTRAGYNSGGWVSAASSK